MTQKTVEEMRDWLNTAEVVEMLDLEIGVDELDSKPTLELEGGVVVYKTGDDAIDYSYLLRDASETPEENRDVIEMINQGANAVAAIQSSKLYVRRTQFDDKKPGYYISTTPFTLENFLNPSSSISLESENEWVVDKFGVLNLEARIGRTTVKVEMYDNQAREEYQIRESRKMFSRLS